jgi:4Fe-4S single cluster domain
MSRDPYCVLPWTHMTSVPDGRSAPCCTWKGETQQQRGQQFFDSTWLSQLRQQMRDHQPPEGCKDCLNSEQLGTYSQRQDGWDVYRNVLDHQQFEDKAQLEYMEINFSNICNFKCRMCGNDRSSKWTTDSEDMGFPVHGKVVNDINITDDMLAHLRYIKLLGGEPLLHDQQLTDILTRAEQLGTLDQLTLGIVTNGSIRPNARLTQLLQACRMVFWTVSVDAYGDLNDYIRTGSSWPVISENLLWFDNLTAQSRWTLGIGSVCLVHNANRMHELADWVDDHLPTARDNHHWYPVNFPEYLSVNRLPGHYLQQLADHYQSLADSSTGMRRDRWWLPLAAHMRQSMAQEPYMNRHPVWGAFAGPSLQLIDRLDGLRGDRLGTVNPEIYLQLRGANQ